MTDLGDSIIAGLSEARDAVKNYKISEVIACYEKLPEYVDKTRFVPGVDECWVVLSYGDYPGGYKLLPDGIIHAEVQRAGIPDDFQLDKDNNWLHFLHDHGWTGTFHPNQASAQEEADRLNEKESE